MSEWLELARRCEQATGADREIGNAILEAIGYRMNGVADCGGISWLRKEPYGWFEGEPTSSLDAITALIERELPGFGVSSQRAPSGDFAKAAIFPDGGYGGPRVQAATEALARCAAFCRAMAERKDR